jgi:hypothetical protein
MILLFSAGGRTGNKLFQLAYAISNRRGFEWLVTFDFAEAKSLLQGPWTKNWFDIGGFVSRIIERYIYPLLYHGLVRTGLASSHYDRETGYEIRRGRLRRLTIIKGFFESSRRLSPGLVSFFRLKESLLAKVRHVVESLPAGSTPVFVHVRRSDFISLAKDPRDKKRMLPDIFYRNAFRILRNRYPNAFLILVGDDPEHAEALFKDVRKKTVSRLSASEDLALMSLCQGGVLSNSTFAWWGAFFGHNRTGYVAPKYWSGWAIKTWLPPEIKADFMTDFVEVTGPFDRSEALPKSCSANPSKR